MQQSALQVVRELVHRYSGFRFDLRRKSVTLVGMKPYSQDLRERVIAAVRTEQQSLSEIARTFGVSESTVDKWAKRWRDTGRVAARPFAGGRRRALRDCAAALQAEVQKQPDVTLAELWERGRPAEVWERVGPVDGGRVGPSIMCRELQRLDLRRKKSRSTTVNATRRV